MTFASDDCRRVSELFRDDLEGTEARLLPGEMAAHVSSCVHCTESFAPDLALLEALAAPPRASAPAWRGPEPLPVRDGRRSVSPWFVVAAAALAVVALLGAWIGRRREPEDDVCAPPSTPTLAVDEPSSPLRRTEFVETTWSRTPGGDAVVRRRVTIAVVRNETRGEQR
jgi:hypothetical protein